MSHSLNPEFSAYQEQHYPRSSPKRFDTKQCSPSKFKELARDPIGDRYTRVSIDEARAAIQAEIENIIQELVRPSVEKARLVDLDCKVKGPAPWTHVDYKHPIGSESLIKQGQQISLENMARRLGEKIVDQKKRFCGLENGNGPVSPENVGHIVDLCYVPSHEKAIVKQNVLQGALDAGSDAEIVFLNDI